MRLEPAFKKIVVVLCLYFSVAALALAQDEIRIALPGEGDTLDPAYMSYVNSFSIASNIYSGLVRYAPGTIDLVPDLATDWEVSDDGLTWTFNIRDDVYWHKGYGKLVAQDIVDSYNRIRDPETGSRFQSDLSMVTDIQAPDDTTVVFTLDQPSAAFLHTVAVFRQGMIVNVQAVEDYGDEYGRNPVGTGAYEFVEWVPGVEVRLRRSEERRVGREWRAGWERGGAGERD